MIFTSFIYSQITHSLNLLTVSLTTNSPDFEVDISWEHQHLQIPSQFVIEDRWAREAEGKTEGDGGESVSTSQLTIPTQPKRLHSNFAENIQENCISTCWNLLGEKFSICCHLGISDGTEVWMHTQSAWATECQCVITPFLQMHLLLWQPLLPDCQLTVLCKVVSRKFKYQPNFLIIIKHNNLVWVLDWLGSQTLSKHLNYAVLRRSFYVTLD